MADTDEAGILSNRWPFVCDVFGRIAHPGQCIACQLIIDVILYKETVQRHRTRRWPKIPDRATWQYTFWEIIAGS